MDGFIKELSKYIGGDWKALARSVGLKKTDIEAISHDNQGFLEEQIYQFFEKWKQQNGRNATSQQLKDGLQNANLLKKLQKAGFSLIDAGKQSSHGKSKFQGKGAGSITCSACGQNGHTKRSKNCPAYIERCYCGLPVVEKTVTKDSVNHGRVFYVCSKPREEQCGYFRWKGDERPPLCKCELPCVSLTATKDTPNKGRKFWKCSKPKDVQCDLFKWVDEEKESDSKDGLKRKRKRPQTSPTARKQLKLEDKPVTINILSPNNVNIST